MTFDKHRIDGIPAITSKTLPASELDDLFVTSRIYEKVIYSPDGAIAITAYHIAP